MRRVADLEVGESLITAQVQPLIFYSTEKAFGVPGRENVDLRVEGGS